MSGFEGHEKSRSVRPMQSRSKTMILREATFSAQFQLVPSFPAANPGAGRSEVGPRCTREPPSPSGGQPLSAVVVGRLAATPPTVVTDVLIPPSNAIDVSPRRPPVQNATGICLPGPWRSWPLSCRSPDRCHGRSSLLFRLSCAHGKSLPTTPLQPGHTYKTHCQAPAASLCHMRFS